MAKFPPGAWDQLRNYFSKIAPISEGEFEDLKPSFTPSYFPRNSFLLRQGELCQSMYFVVKGSFRIFHINDSGQELTRYFAFENKFGTNLTSMIEGSPSVENLQAVEPLFVLEIKKATFFQLVETISQVNKIYRNILQNAYITSQRRIYDLQGMSALDRLKWLLEQYPLILSRIPSRLVASYLGISQYTLSRLKSEL
ncbi:Crp/Fnr family transcriptional regulator [Algoriphagus confluentis]|uniref:Cyclic nucleotide-binding domain-containing protein n=1 Tax=Algoriphagus confluentis TaxID=1697556 RepID=A0ABQ6PHW3_9BACT|nr:cyclic nucleotide-binding domain-containing protein [Algoriphagus confluentis]